MQKYSEKILKKKKMHMLWRAVTNFPSRCYLTGDFKYTEPAKGRMLQKKELAPVCAGREESLLSQVKFREFLP